MGDGKDNKSSDIGIILNFIFIVLIKCWFRVCLFRN